jgi:hypothetical protein
MITLLRAFASSLLLACTVFAQGQTFLLDLNFPGCSSEQLTSVLFMDAVNVEVMSAIGYADTATCSYTQQLTVPVLSDGTYTIQITSYCANAVILEVDTFVVENGIVPSGHSATYPCSGGMPLDCMGVLNGPDMPGTSCDDGLANTSFDIWLPNCLCVGIPDSTTYTDCAGIANGPNVPGQVCDDGDPTTTGEMWNWNCDCVVPGSAPCEADLYIVQAYGQDSVAIPNALWVLNTSTGGDGNYQVLWNFGDGGTSTEMYPTHVYATGGPHLLCLTILDGSGCTDTYCDTISLDEDGMYNGMVLNERPGMLRSGFTLQVLSQLPVGVAEAGATTGLQLVPNPVDGQLGLVLEGFTTGMQVARILDLRGKLVQQHTLRAGADRSVQVLDVGGLEAGIYLLEVLDGPHRSSRRFVKQ